MPKVDTMLLTHFSVNIMVQNNFFIFLFISAFFQYVLSDVGSTRLGLNVIRTYCFSFLLPRREHNPARGLACWLDVRIF